MPIDDDNLIEQELLEEARARSRRPLGGREGVTRLAAAVAFLTAAALLELLTSHASPDLPLLVALIAGLAVVSRVEFEFGVGYTAPIQLVLVPMLLLLPPAVVPGAVALGLVLGRLPDVLRGRAHANRLLLSVGDSWFILGPAVVLAVAGYDSVSLDHWPVYLAALAAQFLCDGVAAAAIDWAALGVRPRLQVRPFAWMWATDALLWPPALAIAYAGSDASWAALLGLPLAALLAVFARERRRGLDSALELSVTYRRTAMLLGDLVAADDAYTGSHSRDVVELAAGVAERMGLGLSARRNVELAALLHDIGKIRIPKAIILKPGPLSDEEFALIKRHTIFGQEMLDRVGGPLAEVGAIVRSSHERFIGGGYPDGLAGEDISLEARIVNCCDSFSAMTTDRPYRAARPLDEAIAELWACAGGQFDPSVVDALCTLIEMNPTLRPAPARPDAFAA
jgi:HD-GYP domain-containing protein (c-di-GMP phosphodiesterase class II)